MWTYLGAQCTGTQLDGPVIELRARELVEFDFDEVMAAARLWARTSKWMPATAELCEAIVASDLPDPDEIWQEMCELMTVYGYSHDFPPPESACSPAAWAAVRAFGWQDLCLGRPEVNRAHVLREIAPRVVERLRRQALTEPRLPELERPSPLELPDLRLDRDDPS